jgi:hypothetical protein
MNTTFTVSLYFALDLSFKGLDRAREGTTSWMPAAYKPILG